MEGFVGYPFQLLDVRLYEMSLERFAIEESNDNEDGGLPSFAFGSEMIKHSERSVSIILSFDINGPSDESPEFNLKFAVEGLFSAQTDLDEINKEIREDFESISSLNLLWPYAREQAHNIFHRMREDVPILPTLDRVTITNLLEGLKSEDEVEEE